MAYAMRDGRIPTERIGRREMIDWAVADEAWAANTDPSKPRNSVTGRPGGASRVNGGIGPAPGTVAAETLRLTEVRTRLAELELARKSGLLVDASEVERHAFDRARAAQKALLAIPARLPLTDMERQALRHELLRVCEQLAAESAPAPEDQAEMRPGANASG